MLPEDQIKNIKSQIISQINSTFPEDKKASAISQIEAMNPEELEEFLKQNNLIQEGQTPSQTQQCIFCSIVEGKAQSYKIDENSDSIAILEINPISKGHCLIIPKAHVSSSENISKKAFSLAKKTAKKIHNRLKPKNVETITANLFGHEIINILPIYENETIESQRYQAESRELEKLKKKLEKKTKPKTIQKSKPKKLKENLWLPKRIP